MNRRAVVLFLVLLCPLQSRAELSAQLPEFFPALFASPESKKLTHLFSLKNYLQAATLATQALLTDLGQEERAAVRFLYALSLFRSGQKTKALVEFDSLPIEDLPPGLSHHAVWYQAWLRLEEGKKDADKKALQISRALLEQIPLQSRFGLDARLLSIKARISSGELDQACALANETVEALNGQWGEAAAWLELGQCKEQQAIALSRQANIGESKEALREVANLYHRVTLLWPNTVPGQLAASLRKNLAGRGIFPRVSDLYPWLLVKLKDLSTKMQGRQFLQLLNRVRLVFPPCKNNSSRCELDLMFSGLTIKHRRFYQAALVLQGVMKNSPDENQRARAGLELAGLKARRNSLEAVGDYLTVAQRFPQSLSASEALFWAGEISRRVGMLKNAEQLFLQCVEIYPDRPAASNCRWGLAWMAFLANQFDAALHWLEFLSATANIDFMNPDSDVLRSTEDVQNDESTDQAVVEELSEVDEESFDAPQLDMEISDSTKFERQDFLEKIRYWRARMREAQGKTQEALADYLQLANQHPFSYYALISIERLKKLRADQQPNLPQLQFPMMSLLPNSAFISETSTPEDSKFGCSFFMPLHMLHPEVAAASSYFRMNLLEEARNTLMRLNRDTLEPLDRRAASMLWLAMGEHRRSLRTAPVPWEGGLPEIPQTCHSFDAQLAYPQAYADAIDGSFRDPLVPPALMFALIRAESDFQPEARSAANAFGLTQMLRATALDTARMLGIKNFQFWMLMKPEMSVRLGSRHFARLLKRFSNHPALAIAAYNAGEGSVMRWLDKYENFPLDAFIEEIPYSETNRYVRKVLSFYAIYQMLYEDGHSPWIEMNWVLPKSDNPSSLPVKRPIPSEQSARAP